MIEFKGRIPDDAAKEIFGAIVMEDITSLFKPIERNSNDRRKRIICPDCGSDECWCFDKSRDFPANVHCYHCGAHYDAVGAVMRMLNIDYHDALLHLADRHGQHRLFGTDQDSRPATKTEPSPFIPSTREHEEEPDLNLTYVDLNRIEECAGLFEGTNLFRYAVEVLQLNAGKVIDTAMRYGCGGIERPQWKSDPCPVIFPYADDEGKIIDAKVLAYRTDGHRVKYKDRHGKEVALTTTLRKIDETSGDKDSLPLFGNHLAFMRRDFSFVAVVESEKSAVLLSLMMPDTLWLAAGSKHWITPHNIAAKLRPFKDCRIRMLPDRNAVEEWDAVADAARSSGYDCQNCRGLIEYYFPATTPEGEQNKSDIWDAFEDCIINPVFKNIGKHMQRSLIRKTAEQVREFMKYTEPIKSNMI